MSASNQPPFARLVNYFQSSFQSNDPISIPAEILDSFNNAAQPLEDRGLQDLVKLFDASNPDNRLRLEPTVLSQLLQIIFRLQASLLQQKLIYSLLVPPQPAQPDVFILWRRSTASKLIPTILRALQERVLGDTLLITASHSLALFVDGDEEAKRAVYSGHDTLRHALGTIVCKHQSYTLRIAVANLIREFLTGKFDRHLFWPPDTPAATFNDFPLAQSGDAAWLAKFVWYLSDVNATVVSCADLPDVYAVQYLFFEGSVAIISDEITLIMPAASSNPLELLHLPLVNGMVCQPTTDLGNEVTIRYRRATGHQICRGIKRAADEVKVVLGDQNSSVNFAESVQSRLAKRFVYSSSLLEPKWPPQRTSYASIDLGQSSETSLESDDEASDLPRVSESNIGAPLPTRSRTQVRAESDPNLQDRATDSFSLLSHAQLNFISPVSGNRTTIESSPGIQASRDGDFIKLSAMPKHTMLSMQAATHALRAENDSKRRLKRPSIKTVQTTGNDIDWDEDLRDNVAGPMAPAAKKPKAASTNAKKAKKVASRKNPQPKLKGVDTPKNTGKPNAKQSRKIATSTRTRRTTTKKSAKYVENSESDSEFEGEGQPSSVVQDSNPLVSKKVPSKEDNAQINDSQGQEKDGLNSYDLDGINTPRAKGSSSSPHQAPAEVKEAVQEEEVNDYHSMDAVARAETLAQNDTSFGTKIAQTLIAKACLRVPAVEQPPKKSFGDVKIFVEAVNDARNSSPQKTLSKEPRNLQPVNRKDIVHQTPSNVQRPADSHAQHSLAQAQAAGPPKVRPESCIGHRSSAGGKQQSDDIQMAPEDVECTIIAEEDLQQAPPKPIEHDMENTTTSRIPKEDLELAAVAGTQVAHENNVVDAVTTTANKSKEIRSKDFDIEDESSEIGLPKSATTAAKWSASKQQSRKVLHDVRKGTIAQKPMGPPPLPRRSERRNIQSPNHMTSKEGDSSYLMRDERTQRKTPIASFGKQGPRNQGVVSPSKQPKLANACAPVPAQTGKHAASKRQKKVVLPEPITLPELAATSGKVSNQSSDVVDGDEEILVQEENAFESTAVGRSSDVSDGDEIVRVQVGNVVEEVPAANAILRRNASQSSRVDENGSPRLLQTRKFLPYAAKLGEISKTSAHSESSAFTSDELEDSAATDKSSFSPIPIHSKRLLQKALQPIKFKVMQSRVSIGLGSIVSAKYPDASKVMNMAVFKKQAESALSKAPVVVEKTSTDVQKVRDVPQLKSSIQQQIIPVEANYAPSSPSPPQQLLLSDPNTRIIRLGPKPPAGTPKAVEQASPIPTSFKTGFKNMLMPPPPLPPAKQGQHDQMGPPTSKGKRKGGPTTEDEDLTLINDEDFVQPRHLRLANRCWPDRLPDSYTDSQSSPMSEHVQPRKDPRKEAQGASSTKIRTTQQHMLSTLNQMVNRVIFRMQEAEEAIERKTQEYHSGCCSLIYRLETTYEDQIQHERSRAAPRVAELCGRYNTIIEYSSKGMQRVRGGTALGSFSEKVGKRRNYLLSLIESQMDEPNTLEQQVE